MDPGNLEPPSEMACAVLNEDQDNYTKPIKLSPKSIVLPIIIMSNKLQKLSLREEQLVAQIDTLPATRRDPALFIEIPTQC